MRKLVLKMSVSIDGFIGGLNGEIDWILRSLDESVTAWLLDTLWQAGIHIMGSRTFHNMAAYWPSSIEPFAAPMNEIPKVVFSKKGFVEPDPEMTTTTYKDATRLKAEAELKPSAAHSLNAATWTDAVVASGDLAKEILHLKQQPRNLYPGGWWCKVCSKPCPAWSH